MSENTSKHTVVCFACRTTAKATWINRKRKCQTCGKPMEDVGKHFNIPKRNDDKAWKASEAFHRENENWPGNPAAERAERLTKQWSARRRS